MLSPNKYLKLLGPDCRKRLQAEYAAEINEFSLLITKLNETLDWYQKARPDDILDPKFVALGLMKKGANTLMAGFELVLSGYSWEPPILYRSALEGFAAAWDVVHNEKRMLRWKSNVRFDSTSSISMLGKEDKVYGKLWGHLSQMNVHTDQQNSSPRMLLIDSVPQFQDFGFLPEGKEKTMAPAVGHSLFLAYVCLQLAEVVFHQYAEAPETIVRVPDQNLVRPVMSQRHKVFADAYALISKAQVEVPESFL